MRIVKQNHFKNLGELHKEWTEAGVKAPGATTHRRVKEFGYSCRQRRLNWAKEKKNWTVAQWSKVLFSDESKFCISFGNQGLRVCRKGGEAHSPSCLKSSVKFPQSVMIWGVMSSAGVGPFCFLKTNVTAPVYQDILEHFMLPSADQLFKDADFISPAVFGTCPHCLKHQKLVKWPWCWCAWLASKLTRPEHQRESMGENEKQENKKCRWASSRLRPHYIISPSSRNHSLVEGPGWQRFRSSAGLVLVRWFVRWKYWCPMMIRSDGIAGCF